MNEGGIYCLLLVFLDMLPDENGKLTKINMLLLLCRPLRPPFLEAILICFARYTLMTAQIACEHKLFVETVRIRLCSK